MALTQATVDNLKPRDKVYWKKENNLCIKVQATGKIAYYCYINRNFSFLGHHPNLTLKQAKVLKTNLYAEKSMGKTQLTKKTFADFVNSNAFQDWSKGRVTHEARMKSMRSTILPILGRYKLKDITEREITNYKNRRVATVAKTSVNRELNDISAVFSQAVGQKLLRKDNVPLIKKFKEDKGRERRVLSRAELKALRLSAQATKGLTPQQKNQKEHIKYIIDIALYCGLRKGEILNLKWGDIVERGSFLEDYLEEKMYSTTKDPVLVINTKAGTIKNQDNILTEEEKGWVEEIDAEKIEEKIYSDYGFKVKAKKTEQTRIIPIAKKLAEELAQYYFIRCNKTDEDFEKWVARKKKVPVDDELPVNFDRFNIHKDHKKRRIFPYTSIDTSFGTARDNAGLDNEITFHCLRHTFCTNALEAGLTLQDVKDLAGHASIATTELYLHTNRRRKFVQYKKYETHLSKMLR